jgi:hypothetical protein
VRTLYLLPVMLGLGGSGLALANCSTIAPASPETDAGRGEDGARVNATSDAMMTPDAGAKPRCDPNGPFEAPVLEPSLSLTGFASVNPSLTPDELTVYFARTPIAADGGIGTYDLFVATRPQAGAPFGAAKPIAELNTPAQEYHPNLSGEALFFVRATTRNTIHFVVKGSAGFGNDTSFEFPDAGVTSDITPWVRADRSLMYFASNRSGQGWDIYRVALPYTGGAPLLVPELNGSGTEGAPTLTADEKTVYFASSRTGGLGGVDVWSATRANGADPFSSPKLETVLSSAKTDDYAQWISPDTCVMYLAIATSGHFRIFVARKK